MPIDWRNNSVTLPSSVAKALRKNRLVFFCGAGVSIPDPSNLPSFVGLARQIALAIDPQTDISKIDSSTQLDVLLGRLDEQHGNVHLRVQEVLESSVLPNELHRHLVRLFSGRDLRIVTTNFDRHFETVLTNESIDVETYTAPALPLGDDFRGLVHLHGRVPLRETERLVVTDRDFGRAYITEGWTTAFLTRLFRTYTVVFVGYSAQDTVIRYLTRALPKGGSLWAITPAAAADGWRPLGVKPIPYEQPGGRDDHSNLASFLADWDEAANADPSAKFDQVEALHRRGPADEETADEIKAWMLQDPEMAVQFMSLPIKSDWVEWVGRNDVAPELFDSSLKWTGSSVRWASWFGRAVESGATEAIVGLLARFEGRLSSQLWVHLVIGLNQSYSATPEDAQLALMLAGAREVRESGRLSMLLATMTKKHPQGAEIMLLQLLAVEEKFGLGARWMSGPNPEMTFSPPWDDYSLREAWAELRQSLVEPDLFRERLVSLLSSLEGAAALFRGDNAHDYISRQRRSVASEADHYSDRPFSLLVDMLRDVLSNEVTDKGPRTSIELLGRRSEIVRRCALHSMGEPTKKGADEVLHALVDGHLLFSYRFRPEAFRAAAAAFPHAAKAAQDELVAHIVEYKDPGAPDRPTSQLRYDLLIWLRDHEGDGDGLLGAISKLESATPNLVPSERPDQTMFFDFSNVPDPEATGRFDGLQVAGLADALAADESTSDPFDGQQTLVELARYLESSPDDATEIVEALGQRQGWSSPLWNTLIEHISRTAEIDQLKRLVEAVLSRPEVGSVAADIARALEASPDRRRNEPVAHQERRLRLIARLWARAASELEDTSDPPSIEWAYSEPLGQLASSYASVLGGLASRRRVRGLNQRERRDLARFVDIGTSNNPALAILGRNAGWLGDFDSGWVSSKLLPLFAFDHPAAPAIWVGMLNGFGWTPFLRQELSDLARSGLDWIKRCLPGSVDLFARHHGYLYLAESRSPDWADNYFIHATDVEKATWLRGLADLTRRDGAPGDATALLEYWSYRVRGLPLAITKREQSAFVGWLTVEGLDLAQAADLFCAGPLISSSPTDYYFHIDYDFLLNHTEKVPAARILLHLVKGGAYLPQGARSIGEHASSIAELSPALARELLGELLVRGYTPARELLDGIPTP